MPTASESRTRTAVRLLLLVWMALIFALSSRHQLPQPAGIPPELIAVVGHFTVYAVLAALLWGGLPAGGWPARRRLGLAFVGALAFALSDEWHQSFVPGRDPALFDLAVDAAGALCAVVVIGLATRTGGSVAEQTGDTNRHRGSRFRAVLDPSVLSVIASSDGTRSRVAPIAPGFSSDRNGPGSAGEITHGVGEARVAGDVHLTD